MRLQIKAEKIFWQEGIDGKNRQNGLKVDDSVSINGVCQTVVSVQAPIFEVIAVQETLQKTTFGSLIIDERNSGRLALNLERAATLQTRLGGHLVQGHVDGTAQVVDIHDLDGSWEFFFSIPAEMVRYIVPVGSITINGVSLTVAEIAGSVLKTAIIPHTYRHTNFQYLTIGDWVNVELDIIVKMVERLSKPVIE